MSRNSVIHAAVLVMALAFSASAQSGAGRTFVPTTGNDSNTSVNCSVSANCRTFAAALAVTSPGGEVVVVNSGGYGPATISQPVIITADGVDASISAPSGNGLTIDTSGNVTIIGLSLDGENTGTNGIEVSRVGFLRLYNIGVQNFADDGVDLPSGGELAMYNSTINDNRNIGLWLQFADAYVHGVSFDNNNTGVLAGNSAWANIVDSHADFNQSGFVALGGAITLSNDRAVFNNTALYAGGGSMLYFSNCLIANNATAYNVAGGTMAGTSPGTSLIAPGQLTTGTLSAPITSFQ
jgi:pectate lyase